MDAMRLMTRLRAAEEKFNAEVERILGEAKSDRDDAVTAIRKRVSAVLDTAKTPKKKTRRTTPHWTQRPENKAKLRAARERGNATKRLAARL